MKPHWILLANAAYARLLQLIEAHPGDRPGFTHSQGRSKEADRFAHELGEHLERNASLAISLRSRYSHRAHSCVNSRPNWPGHATLLSRTHDVDLTSVGPAGCTAASPTNWRSNHKTAVHRRERFCRCEQPLQHPGIGLRRSPSRAQQPLTQYGRAMLRSSRSRTAHRVRVPAHGLERVQRGAGMRRQARPGSRPAAPAARSRTGARKYARSQLRCTDPGLCRANPRACPARTGVCARRPNAGGWRPRLRADAATGNLARAAIHE